MKAKCNQKIRITESVSSDFHDFVIPSGTEGVIVEVYSDPEGYAVDLAIKDSSLVGNYRYENVILKPNQFELI